MPDLGCRCLGFKTNLWYFLANQPVRLLYVRKTLITAKRVCFLHSVDQKTHREYYCRGRSAHRSLGSMNVREPWHTMYIRARSTGTTAIVFRLHKQFPVLELYSSITQRHVPRLSLNVSNLSRIKKKKKNVFLTIRKPTKNQMRLPLPPPFRITNFKRINRLYTPVRKEIETCVMNKQRIESNNRTMF